MRIKSILAFIIVMIFSFVVLVPTANAENVQRRRWEGVAIGIGAAILGSALLKDHHTHTRYVHTRHEPSRYHRHSDHSPYYRLKHHKRRHGREYDHRHGYWEIVKEWVPPTYRRAWNPGHYGRRGKWVPGHWIEIEETPGYWTKTRVWIAER